MCGVTYMRELNLAIAFMFNTGYTETSGGSVFMYLFDIRRILVRDHLSTKANIKSASATSLSPTFA